MTEPFNPNFHKDNPKGTDKPINWRYVSARLIGGLGLAIGLAIANPALTVFSWQWLAAAATIAFFSALADTVGGAQS